MDIQPEDMYYSADEDYGHEELTQGRTDFENAMKHVSYEKLLDETEKAWKILVYDYESWFPKSQCRIYKEDCIIVAPIWLWIEKTKEKEDVVTCPTCQGDGEETCDGMTPEQQKEEAEFIKESLEQFIPRKYIDGGNMSITKEEYLKYQGILLLIRDYQQKITELEKVLGSALEPSRTNDSFIYPCDGHVGDVVWDGVGSIDDILRKLDIEVRSEES